MRHPLPVIRRSSRQFGLARVVCTTSPADEMRAKERVEAGFTDESVHHAWYFDGKKWHDERWFSLVEQDLG